MRHLVLRIMLSLILLRVSFGLSEGFQLVEFKGSGWVLPLGIEAKSRLSVKSGKTWLYLRIDKEDLRNIVWPVTLVAHVWIGDKETVFPVDLAADTIRSNTNKELSLGPIQRLYFTIGQLSVKEDVPVKAYEGPIAHDKPCFLDLLRAGKTQGVAGRKLMADLLTTGCVTMTSHPVTFEIIRTDVLQGVKVYEAFMAEGLSFGFILPNRIEDVSIPVPTEVPKTDFPISSADVKVTEGEIKTDY